LSDSEALLQAVIDPKLIAKSLKRPNIVHTDDG
jgi:hypothetical protein